VASELRPLDPYAVLAALERNRVSYVVIGAFARVVHGAEEVTDGIDITPSLREPNVRRLEAALVSLGAHPADGRELALGSEALEREAVLAFETEKGELKVVPQPAGTRGGYDDLRRQATREPIGKGLRPAVASVADLARMLAALGREEDLPRLRQLRQLRELERALAPEVGL
jgi:hypothetical protein